MTVGQPELVDDNGNATTNLTVGQTLGYKVKWSTSSKVTAGQYFQYKLSTKSANPIAPFTFDVKSASGHRDWLRYLGIEWHCQGRLQ